MTDEEFKSWLNNIESRIDGIEYILAQTIQLITTTNNTIKTLMETQSAVISALKIMQGRTGKSTTSGGHNDPPLEMN